MRKNTIFQGITYIMCAVAFLLLGVAVSMFISDETHSTLVTEQTVPPKIDEVEQIMTFLSLAENTTNESGLYGETDPESLRQSLDTMKESLSDTITTQGDATLYMVYWAATAVNNCVHPHAQTTDQQIEDCIDNMRVEIQSNIKQMTEQEQEILLQSAFSWNVLSSIVEYYNLFIQKNFIPTIERNNNSILTPLQSFIDEIDRLYQV